MSRKPYTPEQIISMLREAEVIDHRHQKPSCPTLMFRPTLANGFGRPINLNRAKR